MGAPMDLFSDWKYAETGTVSGRSVAPPTAEAAQEKNEVWRLFC